MHSEYDLVFPSLVSLLVKGNEYAGRRQTRCLGYDTLLKSCGSFISGAYLLLLLLASLPTCRGEEKNILAQKPRSEVFPPYAADNVTFSPDGRSLIWGCGFYMRTRQLKQRRELAPISWEEASFAALSPDGSLVALLGEGEPEDKTARRRSKRSESIVILWGLKTGKRLAVMKWTPKELLTLGPLVFSPDGRTLASGTTREFHTRRCRVPLWDVPPGKLKRFLEVGKEHSVRALQFSPDGKTLATAGLERDGEYGKWESIHDLPCFLKLWDVVTGKLQTEYKGMKGYIFSIAFSPDGKLLAVGGNLGKQINEIIVWDVATRERRATLTGHRGTVGAVAFSHDGKLLVSAGGGREDDELKLWNVKTFQEVRSLKGHKDSITSVAFSPDDTMLASGSQDGTVRLWYLRDPPAAKDK